jgi:ectoine hydroxylase-related dioxygenase (phytanoyl-CoA dioxygenase family)
MISQDHRFAFDALGYLHLPELLSSSEVKEVLGWMETAEKTDLNALNADMTPEQRAKQLNRPVSRLLDADPRFARLLDHPKVMPYLEEFLGDYRHIDNELYHTPPGAPAGGWHRGVKARDTGYVKDGKFICPMVKLFYCMTSVGPGQGEFTVLPGTHKSQFEIEMEDRVDLPGQYIFNYIKPGDVILFNEGLLHMGRPNASPTHLRKTLIFNFGRAEAGVWDGYKPKPETLQKVTERQRRILDNGGRTWKRPE